uniref:GRIP and coiled-coil domain-containing protein 2 n=1 Tax=Cacopsylla melanoneura TaxID=428564 RepID=A0A8D8RJB4_9HEMI
MESEETPKDSKDKSKLEHLSKEELVQKYTKLLTISRQAQVSKQESVVQLKHVQEKLLVSEKENEELKTKTNLMSKELKESNQLKENVMNKLTQVSVETKHLIEQGDKLTTDIEILKQEKLKLAEELLMSQKQNEILAQNMGDLEVKLMQMNQVKGEMEFKIKELNKKNKNESEVSNTIKKLNEENIALKQKSDLSESENSLVQQTLDKLEKTLDNKDKLIQEYVEKLETQEKRTEEYVEKLEKTEKRCTSVEETRDQCEEKVKHLQEKLNEKEKTHGDAIEQLKEDVEDKLKAMDIVVKEKDEKLSQIQGELLEKEKSIEELNVSLTDNVKVIEELRVSVGDKDKLIEQLKECVETQAVSSSDLNSKDERLATMEFELREKTIQIETLESEVKETNRKLNSLEKTNETNLDRINKFNEELGDKNEAIEKLENDLIEKDTAFKITLQNKVVECDNLLRAVQVELEVSNRKTDELEVLLEETQTQLKQTLEHVASLEEYLKIKDGELEQAHSKMELLEFELDEKSILLKQHETDSIGKDDRIESLENELKTKDNQLGELKSSVQKIGTLESALKSKESELKECTNSSLEVNMLQSELKIKDAQLEELRNGSHSNTNELKAKLESLEKEVEAKRELIGELENVVKDKEETVSGLKESQERLTAELSAEKDRLKTLESELASTTERLASLEIASVEEKRALEHARKELGEKNEQIDRFERIIANHEDTVREKSNQELEKNENFKLNLENLENDNIKCKREIELLVEQLTKSDERVRIRQAEWDSLKEMYDTLCGNYEKLNEDNKRQLDVLVSARNIMSELKQNKLELVTFVSDTQRTILQSMQTALTYSEKIKTIKSEQDAVLREMSQMNESLKGRGEKIYSLNEELAKLRDTGDTLEKEKRECEQKLAELTNSVQELSLELSEEKDVKNRMNEEIRQLKESVQNKQQECLRLKEELATATTATSRVTTTPLSTEMDNRMAVSTDVDSKMETLSTSTMSKADETNRMKDIEDTYEDRYNKLKMLTIKYKKSFAESKDKVTTLTNDNAALINKLQSLTNQIKTTQILQSEYDTLCEKHDAALKTLKSHEKSLTTLSKDKEKLEKALNQTRTSLNEATNQRSELQKQVATLKEKFDEKQVSDIIMRDKDHEIGKLSDTNAHLSEQILELRGRIAQYSTQNVELAQYEKLVEESRVRIQALETQVETLGERSEELTRIQETYASLQSVHSVLESDHRSTLTKLNSLTSSYQTEQTRCEELVLENTALCRDKQTMCDSLEEATNQVRDLKDRLKGVESELGATTRDRERVEKEFEAYKRKAAGVLEKHKREQVDATSANVDVTNIKLATLEKQIDSLKSDLDVARQELSHVQQSLALSCQEKEAALARLELATSELSDKNSTIVQLKQDKINSDMLIIMYKQQVDENQDKIRLLKDSVSQLQDELNRKPKQDSAGVNHTRIMNNDTGDKRRSQERDKEDDDELATLEQKRIEDVLNSNSFVNNLNSMATLYREQGEGSEYTDTTTSPHIPIPLDELLSSSEDLVHHEEDLLAQLSSSQVQILHLTALLNEAENNAARHEQQTNFLKQEIRRLERAVERHPHVQNTEYLKNVIIKFLTLQGGDERQRLVPVLNTMLKLSPEEVKQLTGVAKGYTGETGSSWSSLLGGWTSSSSTT